MLRNVKVESTAQALTNVDIKTCKNLHCLRDRNLIKPEIGSSVWFEYLASNRYKT
jgi:hypothetical protein